MTVSDRIKRYFKMPFATDASGMTHGSENPVTKAVNEAVVNALVHAYYGTDAEVRVVLSENEVEVSNSDSFLIDHAVAVAGGITAARNPTLMNMFYLIGASDRAGSGLYSIWSIWQWVWGAVPTLEELHSPVKARTIMSLVSPKGNDEFESHGAAGQDLSKVIALAKRVTAADVAMAFAVSERMAQKRLMDQSGGRVTRVRDGRVWRCSII